MPTLLATSGRQSSRPAVRYLENGGLWHQQPGLQVREREAGPAGLFDGFHPFRMSTLEPILNCFWAYNPGFCQVKDSAPGSLKGCPASALDTWNLVCSKIAQYSLALLSSQTPNHMRGKEQATDRKPQLGQGLSQGPTSSGRKDKGSDLPGRSAPWHGTAGRLSAISTVCHLHCEQLRPVSYL